MRLTPKEIALVELFRRLHQIDQDAIVSQIRDWLTQTGKAKQ